MGASKSIRRIALLLPLIAFLLAGLYTLAVAPFAWGAGEHLTPAWLPSAIAGVVGGGSIVIALGAIRDILRRTHDEFEVSLLQIAGGFVILGFATPFAVNFGLSAPAFETYAGLENEDGTVAHWSGLAFSTLLMMVIGGLFVGAGAYIYSHAITPVLTRYLKQESEPDTLGALLNDMEPRSR